MNHRHNATNELTLKIVAAFTTNRNNREIADGWDLLVNGVWHERYRTLKDTRMAAKAIAGQWCDGATIKTIRA